ncbi:D-alanine--D-alanine ligase [Anoxybacillus sp. CHMUD]|uniref:D-alanine--D-alanine ligase n=1 Tax=Anoxybacillus TaxID=150247 RepID=UPI00100949B5|nr:D-alanine--D-alanine ligase [Anoxybacillus sp. CHMUD]NNU91297.1 D-alanine--D-alanine ligase [Anoxybacillus sp. CHMUD]QAV25348.1 D-alanine--D-alanine ligase [Neobacillus thermocopriae]
MKITLGILYGGKSPEHKVSLQTARSVINAINKEKFTVVPIYITTDGQWLRGEAIEGEVQNIEQLAFQQGLPALASIANRSENKEERIDVIFPLLHGPNGEDGTVQGMLELLNVPYVGNGVLASAVGMDKVVMKQLFAQAGLKQARYVFFLKKEWEKHKENVYETVKQEIGYPCFVKPANAGSSVGISKCKNREQLQAAFQEAFRYDRKVIVEEAIIGREVEIGVVGNDEPICSVVGEIVPKKEFYDYEAKYVDGNTELVIPANITHKEYETIKQMALTAFKVLDLAGLVRADFFLTADGEAYINEVNTMPGFTPFSMFPLLWKHTGVSYEELIERLIQLAIERYEEKQNITYVF